MGTSSACDTAAEILCSLRLHTILARNAKKKRSLAQGRDSLRFLLKNNYILNV
nr:hypothetical protein XPJYXGBL_XPJYXGBL_CDS_0006 [Microvirus sp.]